MKKTLRLILALAALALGGCATEWVLPPPQCSYIAHYEHPCSENVAPANEDGKPWSCKLPSPHFAMEDQHCRWDQ
jgi:hypothetical protein